jgi:hypothetical protein
MPPTTARSTSPYGAARRRRPARRLDPVGLLPPAQTAAAMDDATEAQALIDDLVALLDAGLITTIYDSDTVRYEVVERQADAPQGGRPVTVGVRAQRRARR